MILFRDFNDKHDIYHYGIISIAGNFNENFSLFSLDLCQKSAAEEHTVI